MGRCEIIEVVNKLFFRTTVTFYKRLFNHITLKFTFQGKK